MDIPRHPIQHATETQPEVPTPSPSDDLVERYVATMQRLDQSGPGNQPTVEVNQSLGMLAFAYEKIRNSVEYREDHLLLRSAIKRILKRRLNPFWQYDSLAQALIRELIWARYLPSDGVPATRIEEVEAILRKFDPLRLNLPSSTEVDWLDWLLGLMACEIEQTLVDHHAAYTLAEVMYQWLLTHLNTVGLDPGDRSIQLYLAVHRTLLKSDRTLLGYHLFLLYVPGWEKNQTDPTLAAQLPDLCHRIQAAIDHPLAAELTRGLKRFTPPFIVLDTIVHQHPTNALTILKQPGMLRKAVEDICRDRYGQLHHRVRTAIIRSMIYILITKMALALLLEVPFDRLVYGAVAWPQLAVNILFPPLLMAILGLSIKTPSPRNTEVILDRLTRLVNNEPNVETLVLGRPQTSFTSTMSIVYLLTSLGAFVLVAWLLNGWGFSPLAIGLFLFFVCVVVFFAYRVRQIAQEFSVVREKENILESLLTLITLPFLRLGYRLSAEFGKVNVFAFVLDFLLEAPFKLILDMIEHWLNFVRQKREETIDGI